MIFHLILTSVYFTQLCCLYVTGTQVLTRHIRDGRELPELNRDNHYSTHFQEIRLLKRPVRVLPVIIHVHSYDVYQTHFILLRLKLIDF